MSFLSFVKMSLITSHQSFVPIFNSVLFRDIQQRFNIKCQSQRRQRSATTLENHSQRSILFGILSIGTWHAQWRSTCARLAALQDLLERFYDIERFADTRRLVLSLVDDIVLQSHPQRQRIDNTTIGRVDHLRERSVGSFEQFEILLQFEERDIQSKHAVQTMVGLVKSWTQCPSIIYR